jgi:hypothetical protein
VLGLAAAAVAGRSGGDGGGNVAPPPTTSLQVTTAPPVTVTERAPEPEPEPEPEVVTVPAPLTVSEARALQDESTRQARNGAWPRSLELAERALEALVGRDLTYEAYANFNIGNALAHLGRCVEALPHLDRREELLGGHPAVESARRLCGA